MASCFQASGGPGSAAASGSEGATAEVEAAVASEAPPAPPGIVIDHLPASSGTFVGSPTLAILPDGTFVAAHDFFGPGSTEWERARTDLFASHDRGATWERIATVDGAFWSNLFVHADALHLMGVTRHHGPIVIRRSGDGGRTWTDPVDAGSGLLTDEGEYHTAPMPVVVHAGRIWRAFEDAGGGTQWGRRYRAMMLSAPLQTAAGPTDLLDRGIWTFSDIVPSEEEWLGGCGGWLEGNAVVGGDDRVCDILRVDLPQGGEKAAVVEISPDGRTARFDPETGFIDFPGGAKKFTIRRDPLDDPAGGPVWWTLATAVPPSVAAANPELKPAKIRNTLVLLRSGDLRTWEMRSILLHHPDVERHGFQYVDWLFDGDDMVAVCRTAFDDAEGGARSAHDANYLTFHRVAGFRALGRSDGPVDPATLGW